LFVQELHPQAIIRRIKNARGFGLCLSLNLKANAITNGHCGRRYLLR
jgi:hypothetical protein